MLPGVLGQQLTDLTRGAGRFVDLFAGSGTVVKYVATAQRVPTVAVDLMAFSGVLTAATIERTSAIDASALMKKWKVRCGQYLQERHSELLSARKASQPGSFETVMSARELWEGRHDMGFISRHYGGHYYSPEQALRLDAWYATMPPRAPHRTVALSALLQVASRASASPGHTAQPFQPTTRLLPHIALAWGINIDVELERKLRFTAASWALERGRVHVGDGIEFVNRSVTHDDVVFCDPPYSNAQYSRFYHVLEGIAVGGWSSVSGAGRAPVAENRPTSSFSLKSRASAASLSLLNSLAAKGATVLWTYPEGERSNGLTVGDIREFAVSSFAVEEYRVPMRHSTLGGSPLNHAVRHGRKELFEVLFKLTPK